MKSAEETEGWRAAERLYTSDIADDVPHQDAALEDAAGYSRFYNPYINGDGEAAAAFRKGFARFYAEMSDL